MYVHQSAVSNTRTELAAWYSKNEFEDVPPDSSPATQSDSGKLPKNSVSSGRILVVEDESIVALDLRNTLRHYGHVVVGIADSGDEAIIQARLYQPDVILMDIRLHGPMDGVEVATIISHELKIPIIFITAQADAATRKRALMTTPAGYLTKPFIKEELVALLDFVLND